MKRTTNPLVYLRRFMLKVHKTDQCWLWTGQISTGGYGRFWDGTRLVQAHRWLYEQIFGPVAPELDIDHMYERQSATRGIKRPPHRRYGKSLV